MGSRRAWHAGAHALAPAAARGSLALALAAYASVVGLLCAAMVAWMDPACVAIAVGEVPALAPMLLVANLVPPVLACLFLLALTRRPLLSAALALLLLYLLYVANAIKLGQLGTPLLPADFVLLAHLGDGGALLSLYVPRRMQMVLVVVIGAMPLLALREPPWRRLRGLPRGLLLAAAVALATSLVSGTRPWSRVYAAEGHDFLSWSPEKSARTSGLPATLLRYAWTMPFALPEPDRAQARRLLAAYPPREPAPVATDELPDIVVVQSESFFDAARLRGLEAAQVLPEFRRLAAHARHGEVWVPTYGGGTIRTEFEVLTGLAMRYFPAVQYPYFRLTAQPMQSLASVLRARGYRTLVVHPNVRGFWNRASAFANMGFDAFHDLVDFAGADRVGHYVGDDALVDHLLEELGRTRQPLFVFAISMENHGPYHDYPNVDPARVAAQPAPSGLDAEAARALRGYLLHLENADRTLGRLADALERRPRRSLLLFYGDHLPALPLVYGQAGFDDGRHATEQPAPWLLYDTAGMRSAREDTAAFYLPALLLDAAGIVDGGFFDVLDGVRRADAPHLHWRPVDDEGLRALTLLRQRRMPVDG